MTEPLALAFEMETPPESTLIVAFPESGLAGLSANQYLIEKLELEETGFVHAEGMPAITPYFEGSPYHHTRLFSKAGFDYTVLTSELPVPIQFSEPFGRQLVQWIEERQVEEVTLLTTIPSLELREGLFYVASDDYVETRLADQPIEPLTGGFLTGVNASLTSRAIDTSLRVGVLATAGNPYVPVDGEATLRIVEGLDDLYDLPVDTEQLEEFAEKSAQYYRDLTAHIEAQQQAGRQHSPTEDYGYM